MELTLGMSLCPNYCIFFQNSVEAELIYRNHCAKKHLNVSLIVVESGRLAKWFHVFLSFCSGMLSKIRVIIAAVLPNFLFSLSEQVFVPYRFWSKSLRAHFPTSSEFWWHSSCVVVFSPHNRTWTEDDSIREMTQIPSACHRSDSILWSCCFGKYHSKFISSKLRLGHLSSRPYKVLVWEDVDFDSSDLTTPFEQSNSMSWLRIQLLSNQRSLGVLGPRITDNSQISLFISSNDCPIESQICFFRVFSSLMNCCVKSDIHEHSPNNHIHIRNIVQDRLCVFQIFFIMEKTDSMQCDVSDDDKVVPISLPQSFDFPRQLKLTLCARRFLQGQQVPLCNTKFQPQDCRSLLNFLLLDATGLPAALPSPAKGYFSDSKNSWHLVDGDTSTEPCGNPEQENQFHFQVISWTSSGEDSRSGTGFGYAQCMCPLSERPKLWCTFKTTITSTCCRKRACTIVSKTEHFGHLNLANHKVLIEESESKIRLRTQLGNTVDILIPVQIKTFSSTQEPSVVPRANEETKIHLHWQFLGIWKVFWRIVLDSLYVNTKQIRNKWCFRKSSAQNERRNICYTNAIRSRHQIVGRFCWKLKLSAKHSLWKAVRNVLWQSSNTVWNNGRMSPCFCERAVETTVIWSKNLARYISRLCIVRGGESGKETLLSQTLKNWKRWTLLKFRPKARCKGSVNADERWQFYILSRRWNNENPWRKSTFETIHLNQGSSWTRRGTRSFSRKIRRTLFSKPSSKRWNRQNIWVRPP